MKKLISAVLIILSVNIQAEISLLPGTNVAESIVDDATLANRRFSAEMASLIPGNKALMKAFTNLGSGNIYYSLYSDMQIRKFDVATKQYLGHWPLSRWTYLIPPNEISKNITNYYKKINYRDAVYYSSSDAAAGCLSNVPLRYGDIDTDTQSELVLFLNGELIVFSPERQRTVFAMFWQADDWKRDSDKYNNKPSEDGPVFQFASAQLGVNGVIDKAMRSYSKLFIGDVDGDAHKDFVVWQKVYQSNTADEAPGFKLVRQSFTHYERDLSAQAKLPAGVTGEYLPQTTATATIQTWLADSNQTWLTGYPSISECAGQAGQRIPEMHDPLLNDPEVLPPAPTPTP